MNKEQSILTKEEYNLLVMYHEHLLKLGIQIPNGAIESFLQKVKK